MKITGKNPRMFIGDYEIKGCESFSLNTGDTSKYEKIVLEGVVYDPVCFDGESWESISAKMGDEFIATINMPNGEERVALLRAAYKDGIVTLEPVDKEIREWVKGWMDLGGEG